MTQNDRARQLRQDSTDAEAALWRKLRSSQLAGAKFRRQQPIGPFIVDFVSFSHRLIIECDGGQHADSPRDGVRDAWLAGKGFRTVRFWNNDVLANLDGVLAVILDAVEQTRCKTPSPQPSPARGEGG